MDGFNGTSAADLPPLSPSHIGQATAHAATVQHKAIVIRGLPGVGKTTLANAIVDKLTRNALIVRGAAPPFHVNADIVRRSLSSDLGFRQSDRMENARRIGAVAALAQLNGFIPVVDFVMPTRPTADAFREGFGLSTYAVFTLVARPGFTTRFADTGAMFEPDPFSTELADDSIRPDFHSIQPFGRGEIQLLASLIIRQVLP